MDRVATGLAPLVFDDVSLVTIGLSRFSLSEITVLRPSP